MFLSIFQIIFLDLPGNTFV